MAATRFFIPHRVSPRPLSIANELLLLQRKLAAGRKEKMASTINRFFIQLKTTCEIDTYISALSDHNDNSQAILSTHLPHHDAWLAC